MVFGVPAMENKKESAAPKYSVKITQFLIQLLRDFFPNSFYFLDMERSSKNYFPWLSVFQFSTVT